MLTPRPSVLAALSLLSGFAHGADEFFANVAAAEWNVGITVPNSIDGRLVAAGFVTAGSETVLESAAFSLWNPNDSSILLQVKFFDDAGGRPGSLIGQFPSLTVPGQETPSPGLEDHFWPAIYTTGVEPGGISLAANSTYWMVLESLEDTPFPKRCCGPRRRGRSRTGIFRQCHRWESSRVATTGRPMRRSRGRSPFSLRSAGRWCRSHRRPCSLCSGRSGCYAAGCASRIA